MSIVREKVERVVVEEGAPFAVCDGCGKRADAVNFARVTRPMPGGPDWTVYEGGDHPKGWLIVWPEGWPSAAGLLGFCSWPCLAKYVKEKA